MQDTRRNFSIAGLAFSVVVLVFWFDCFFNGHLMHGHEDRIGQTLPLLSLHREFFRNFTIPQWNPYLFAGMNMAGSSDYHCFYPPLWLIYALPGYLFHFAMTVFLITHVFLTLVFSYLFLSQFTKHLPIRIGLSIALTFSTGMIVNIICGVNAFVFMTYLAFSLYLVETVARRSWYSNLFLQTLSVTFSILGGILQTTIYAILIIMGYSVYRHVIESRQIKQCLLTLSSLLLSCGISAIRIISFYLAAKYNIREDIGMLDNFLIHDEPLTDPMYYLRMFMPTFFGTQSNAHLFSVIDFTRFTSFFDPIEIFSCYSGTICAHLFLYGLFFLWDMRTLPFKILTFLVLLTISTTPMAYLHALLTGSPTLFFGRLAWLLPIVTLPVAAISFDRIVANRKKLKQFILFSCLATLVVTKLAEQTVTTMPQELIRTNGSLISISLIYFFGLSLLMIVLFLGYLRFCKLKRFLILVSSFVIIADVVLVAFIEREDETTFSREPPFFETTVSEERAESLLLGEEQFRIIGKSASTIQSKNIYLKLPKISGFESTPPYYTVRLLCYPEPYNRIDAREAEPFDISRLFLFSAKYLVTDDHLHVLSQKPIPRFSCYNSYKLITDDSKALSAIHGMRFDPYSPLILNAAPTKTIPSQMNSPSKSVDIIADEFNRIELNVFTEQNTLLLINDSFDPGWSVKIDGTPDDILRANYAFKAIQIPKGEHSIILTYVSPGMHFGIAVSLISIAVLLILFFLRFFNSNLKATPYWAWIARFERFLYFRSRDGAM